MTYNFNSTKQTIKQQFEYGLITFQEARDELERDGHGEIEAQRMVAGWENPIK